MTAATVTGPQATDPDRVGGKAAQLAALERAGARVPPWFALTTEAFERVRRRVAVATDRALKGLDFTDRRPVEAASAAIRDAVHTAGLEAADEDELLLRCDALLADAPTLAVRSSAVGEDSAEASFAGQLDTRLHVAPDDLVEAVLDVLASAWSPRALVYRHTRQLQSPLATAVVVQAMVPARSAGVMFTTDPASGDEGVAVVSAALGLGEGVVADLVETDTWFVEKASGAVRRAVVRSKTQRVILDASRGQGTRLEAVPAAEQEAPALTDDQLVALVALGRSVEADRGGPQDIEWALDADGGLFVLQTRPVTTLPGGRERLFDNTNVVEGYPGVTTPLTFSFVRSGYEQIFRASARAFGVPEATVAASDAVFRHMVGYVDGRVYYDLLNWYRLYAMVPGFEERVRAWEAALGLPPRAEATQVQRTAGEAAATLPQRLRTLWRVVRNFVRLEADVRRFKERFHHVQTEFERCGPETQDADGLVDLYEFLVRELLAHWEITTVNDFYAFQLFDLLGTLLARWGVDADGSLRNDLLCGERGMESVEPVRSLFGLAAQVRAGERLTALFAKPWTDSQVLATVLTEPGLGAFRDAVTAHVQAFGDRTLHELKLETPTLGDEPQQVIGQLRGLLASDRSLDALERREAEVRAAAEGRVAAALGGPKAWALGFVLKHTRASVRFREDLRLARSRAFGMVKRIFRRLGRLLAEAKLLPAADDVFLLTVEEVVGTVRGCATTRNLGALVELRRAEQEDHRLSDPTPRVRTRGIVYALPFSQVRVPATARDLVGMGCAPGRVRARARVVHDPAAAEPVAGEILVARQTDPGWVFLMVTAAGLVVERGSLLSHTAIIGRELGIPTVVGVPGATSRIRTGDLVELDGEAGTVRLVTDPGGDAGEEAPAATAPAKPAAPAEPAADAKPADADAADAKPADTDAKPADTDAADAKPTASSDAASGDGA